LIAIATCLLGGQLLAAEHHALLVGCSKYSQEGIRELVGAENDVRSIESLLAKQFGFRNITKLVGWPNDPQKRPTHSNITAAFERLISAAGPGSQVVILMAGHGFRFPLPKSQVDVLDPKNPEPDGKDEAFLAADYQSGRNMILDNHIGQWLERLKAKGAHVWIIFDSCFSGTMTRGGSGEVDRELTAAEAGVDLDEIRRAEQRAHKAHTGTRASTTPVLEGFDVPRKSLSSGSVVAFYAAQEFETAPEVTRPRKADRSDRRFKHGLLSYHLGQELQQRKNKVTYRDLGRALVSRYRADGRRRPTPHWEGDLDREVLGQQRWPRSSAIYVERVDGRMRLTGGRLAGLRDGTVVAVYRSDDKQMSQPLGHLKVSESTATAAFGKPVAFGGRDAPDPESLPDNSVCRIVSEDLGAMPLRLRLLSVDEDAEELEDAYAREIDKLSTKQRSIYHRVRDAASVDWVFARLTPTAVNRFLHEQVSAPIGILLPAKDATRLLNLGKPGNSTDKPLARVPHTRFTGETLNNPSKLAKLLADDLRRIHVWTNFWQVAGAYSINSPLVAHREVFLEVAMLDGPDDRSAGKPLDGSRLASGDYVVLRVANVGYQPYWYALFFLDGRFGIHHIATKAIKERNFKNQRETRVEQIIKRFKVNENMHGANGFVLVAVRQKEHPIQPDYRFLAQTPLGTALTRASANTQALKTPFERLLLNTLGGDEERFRSSQSPDEPQVSAWSWVTK